MSPISPPIIEISQLSKTYESGFQALQQVNLSIQQGEILALLGPNGAGKTTLISIICGIVTATQGRVTVGGFDTVHDYRATRSLIGLVPQELTTDAFETVWDTVSFSRGLFGKPANPAHIERVLKDLSLWDKKDNKIITLSGGMKRRLLIAKALSHEPQVLFLDEPTAGVDVNLRRDMWALVRKLQEQIGYFDQNKVSVEKARNAYRQQFDIGQRTLLDLLDTENELFQARRAVANAEQD